jgi:hypothetical protein
MNAPSYFLLAAACFGAAIVLRSFYLHKKLRRQILASEWAPPPLTPGRSTWELLKERERPN